MKDLLSKLANIQYKYRFSLLVFYFFVTLILGLGIFNLGVEPDINKGMPQDMPIYQLNDRITEEFGGGDVVIILLELDEATSKDAPNDIRNPQVIDFIVNFEKSIINEPKVVDVISSAQIYKNFPYSNKKEIIAVENYVPQLSMFYDDEYKFTSIYVVGDIGKEFETVKGFEKLIQDKVQTIGVPGNVKISISGSPSISKTIFEFLIEDAIFTLLIAAILIFIMLLILERDLIKSILIFLPLIFSIIWLMGILGHIDLKLSMATAGLGAILLGLGIEYGVFMVERYYEERKNGLTQKKSLEEAVVNIGSAILGSGTTTFIGFISLTFSILPMMRELGLSLALGIVTSIFAVIFVTPVIIIIVENFRHKSILNKHSKMNKKVKKIRSEEK